MTFNKLKFMLIIQGFAYANKPIYLMFIRHAEKKPEQPKNLSPVGWQRAEYISKLFTGKINGHPCLSEFLLNNTIYKLTSKGKAFADAIASDLFIIWIVA